MPRIRKNVRKTDLTAEERQEFEAVGFTDKEIDKIQEHLKADSWLFWAEASELFITLAGGQAMVLESGKPVLKDFSSFLKFEFHYATVTNREKAKLVFQSDAYREGRIKLSSEHLADEKERRFAEYKNEILRDKEMSDRLKRELAGV